MDSGASWGGLAAEPPTLRAGRKEAPVRGTAFSLLVLKRMLQENHAELDWHLTVYTYVYGLLGLMHEHYQLPPTLPANKLYVAPEAVIGRDGKLRHVDPATEGMELLLELLSTSLPRWRPEKREAVLTRVALPSEIYLLPRTYHGPWRDSYRPEPESVTWDVASEPYGGLLVLDAHTPTRVSVLSTSERLADWQQCLEDLPEGPFEPGDPGIRRYLNSRITGISPYSPEHGAEFRRGWQCSSLLQAVYLMIWLDLTGGRSVRECALHDCFNHFREGSQPSVQYCSTKHTSLASTRASRDRSHDV